MDALFYLKIIFGRRLQPTTKLTVLRFPNKSSGRKAPTTMVKLKISENLGFTKTYYKIEISQKRVDRKGNLYYCTK